MGNSVPKASDFESVKARLAEIADAVSDDALSLDDALDLYEEAVALGLQASDLLETGIDLSEGDAEGESGEGQGDASGTASAGRPVADEDATRE